MIPKGREVMERFIHALLLTIAVLVAGTTAVLWTAGIADFSVICTLGIGAIVVSVVVFIVSVWVRLPFLRLDQSLTSLMMIVIVIVGMLFLLPWLRSIFAT